MWKITKHSSLSIYVPNAEDVITFVHRKQFIRRHSWKEIRIKILIVEFLFRDLFQATLWELAKEWDAARDWEKENAQEKQEGEEEEEAAGAFNNYSSPRLPAMYCVQHGCENNRLG